MANVLRMTVRVIGELLVTAGLLLFAFLGWQLFWTDVTANHDQAQIVTSLEHTFATAPTKAPLKHVALGDAFALVRVPRWGADYVRPVHEGTDKPVLQRGIGHYVGTTLPGQVGNFATAGHRTTYGKPYTDIDLLQKGDKIIVETAAGYSVYAVESHEVVLPTQGEVIAPVPDHPGQPPTKAYMTMTSCNPKFSAATRWVVHALLVANYTRAQGVPPADLAVPAGK